MEFNLFVELNKFVETKYFDLISCSLEFDFKGEKVTMNFMKLSDGVCCTCNSNHSTGASMNEVYSKMLSLLWKKFIECLCEKCVNWYRNNRPLMIQRVYYYYE